MSERAERFVTTTCGSVMVTVLIHQGWKIKKQNVFRELGRKQAAAPGQTGPALGGDTRIWVPAGREQQEPSPGTPGLSIWHFWVRSSSPLPLPAVPSVLS